ncbi:preprotein translocase subunit SecG [Arsenophonus symbiont of Ornithomya chloropus]|uniref:preprotein translocase subunit SecG n=1 Tax=Arsenophonus symbiont of Ornithomya chloropus TaxID=634121 RepID=UPI0032B289B9
MYVTILCVFLLISISLIAMIILQQGKSADNIGPAFHVATSATLFSSSGLNKFMILMTVIFATLFFVISLILGNLTSKENFTVNQWENIAESSKVEGADKVLLSSTSPTIDVPKT